MRDGFYWIQTHGTEQWTIAQYTRGWWDVIGSLHTFDHKDFGEHFRLGGFVGDKAGWTWETIDQWKERYRGLEIGNAVGCYWAAWDDILNVEYVVFSNLSWREAGGSFDIREPKFVMRIARPPHPERLQPVATEG